MTTFDLTPMEPLSWVEPFDAPNWLFQVKWDGVRMLVTVTGGQTSLINRKGHSRTAQYPELAVLSQLIPTDTVLDGEIVVFANGKPSFSSIIQRDFSRLSTAIRARQVELPVTYFVFDLLYLHGDDVRTLPLRKRQELLESVWPGNRSSLHLVESFPSGRELFSAVKEQGLEGIVAKLRDSAYLPGKHSDAWRKIKCFKEVSCLVGGYTLRQGQLSALLLGLYSRKELVYIGAAGSGLNLADWQALVPFFKAAERAESPFSHDPVIRDRELHWLEPTLAVRVKFMEWSPDLKLRAPVILGFQVAEATDCSFASQGV